MNKKMSNSLKKKKYVGWKLQNKKFNPQNVQLSTVATENFFAKSVCAKIIILLTNYTVESTANVVRVEQT